MIDCERCGEQVEQVLRHREYGLTTTHRVSRWLCHRCHPTAPTSDSGEEGVEPAVATDGGTAVDCPECTASTVDVHGIRNCTRCRWQRG